MDNSFNALVPTKSISHTKHHIKNMVALIVDLVTAIVGKNNRGYYRKDVILGIMCITNDANKRNEKQHKNGCILCSLERSAAKSQLQILDLQVDQNEFALSTSFENNLGHFCSV